MPQTKSRTGNESGLVSSNTAVTIQTHLCEECVARDIEEATDSPRRATIKEEQTETQLGLDREPPTPKRRTGTSAHVMPRQGTPDETSKGRKCAPIAGNNSLKKHSMLVTTQIKPVCENLDDCIYNDMEVKSELFEPEAANPSGNQFSGAVNHEAPAHDSLGGPTRLLIFKPASADVASPSGHLVSVGRVGNTSSKAKVEDRFGGAVDFKKGLPSTPGRLAI
ncbi:uncharacterized protein RSE6_11446 [Rhynchosporium secalis]|uniref:Uncharacterized protein n=1 Tax=Rhynchosporium secalis TaxID=38038 RepID=A0A1E1MMZ5_RHYSE|nr:uncharacterized protein RSE6_11446 [Rhynchosporium secalis]